MFKSRIISLFNEFLNSLPWSLVRRLRIPILIKICGKNNTCNLIIGVQEAITETHINFDFSYLSLHYSYCQ